MRWRTASTSPSPANFNQNSSLWRRTRRDEPHRWPRAQPHCRIAGRGERHGDIFRRFFIETDTRGSRVDDARFAALTLCSKLAVAAFGKTVMTNPTHRLLIKHGTLIDGSGRDPVMNTLIVVEGNKIAHVGRADDGVPPESPDEAVIDAAGKFILPGIIDAHCHISLHQGALPGVRYTSSAEFCTLWAAHAIGRVLRAGVTSIAVPGGKWFSDVTVREAVEGGLLEGPRMVVAGRALSNYGGIFDPDPYPASEGTPADTAGVLCNTRDEFIRETRKQCKRGVDLIKIADSTWGDVQTVADDEISAVVDEAHRHNVKVTIHSRGSTSTRAAAEAGVDLIYHGDLATEDDLDIIAKAGMPIAPVLTSPWIGVEHGAAARGFGDRVRGQLDASFQMIRNARARGIA